MPPAVTYASPVQYDISPLNSRNVLPIFLCCFRKEHSETCAIYCRKICADNKVVTQQRVDIPQLKIRMFYIFLGLHCNAWFCLAVSCQFTFPSIDMILFSINTLSPRQNGRHFTADVFKCIFLNENICISIIFQHLFRSESMIVRLPTHVNHRRLFMLYRITHSEHFRKKYGKSLLKCIILHIGQHMDNLPITMWRRRTISRNLHVAYFLIPGMGNTKINQNVGGRLFEPDEYSLLSKKQYLPQNA